MHKIGLLLLTLLIVAGVTACGGAPASDAPAPEEPAASTLPALSQTVTSDDGVTVSYPEGWLDPVATIGVFLYNNADGQSTLNFMRARPGGMAFQINKQPGTSGRTPAELFDFSFNTLASGMGITLGEKQTITLGGVEIIKATGANTTAGSEIGLYAALKPVTDGFATFIVYLHPDDIEAQTPLIEAILESLSASSA